MRAIIKIPLAILIARLPACQDRTPTPICVYLFIEYIGRTAGLQRSSESCFLFPPKSHEREAGNFKPKNLSGIIYNPIRRFVRFLFMDYNEWNASIRWIGRDISMKERLFRWGPAILIMGLIFIASSTSGSDIPDFGVLDFCAKKGGHFLGYALLGATYLHALIWNRNQTRSRLLTAGVLVILYAISDEWHQGFTPERHPSFLDLCIDTAGGFLGIACLHLVRKRLIPPGAWD